MPSLLRRAKRAFSSDFFKLAMIIAIGAVIWNISPTPQLSANAFHVLSTFCCVILCLLCLPCTPIGLIVAPALIVLTLSQSLKCEIKGTGKRIDCSMCNNNKSLTEGQAAYNCDGLKDGFDTALSGYSKQLSWLVLLAFMMGKAVEKSKLGTRVSLLLVRLLGDSIWGLGYAIFIAEFILAPFIPSNTARGGGIVMPVVAALISLYKSSPSDSPQIGRFLIICASHANFLSSSVYMTGTIGNPVVAAYAAKVFVVDFGYLRWTAGAIVPALVCLILLVPLFSVLSGVCDVRGRKLVELEFSGGGEGGASDVCVEEGGEPVSSPTQPRSSSNSNSSSLLPLHNNLLTASSPSPLAPVVSSSSSPLASQSHSSLSSPKDHAKHALALLGPPSLAEKKLCLILFLCLLAWSTASLTHLPEALVALSGLLLLVMFDAGMEWKDVTGNAAAWDAFFWLAGMMVLAEQITEYGVAQVVGESATHIIKSLFPTPTSYSTGIVATLLLTLVYMLTMYIFSSITAHMLALSLALLQSAATLNAPPLLATALIAYTSSLAGCLTNYSSGSSVIYFAFGFWGQGGWLSVGGIVGMIYLLVYMTVGLAWWKVIGFY